MKKWMIQIAIVLMSFNFAQAQTANPECPLGAKEDHLTIQRVMLNFGKSVSDADALSVKSSRPQETILDSELQTAADKLAKAIACADAVVKNPTGDLLPGHFELIQDEAQKKEKIDDYIYFMNDFKDGLVEYRDVVLQTLKQKSAERNFQDLQEKSKDINQRVNRAHTKLFN